MARFYFYIALFFLQKSEIKSVYNCSYYSKLFLKPNKIGCENFICWESQISDRNRNELTKMFNEYRTSVSTGTCASCSGQCYGTIFKLSYHWVPEYTSVLWLQNIACTLPPNISAVPPLPYDQINAQNLYAGLLDVYIKKRIHVKGYGSINTFRLEYYESRNDVIEKIKNILLNEDDSKRFLNSWEEDDDSYNYGGFSFFGCAILVLNNMTGKTDFGGKVSNERVAFLACMFVPYLFHERISNHPVARKVYKYNSRRDCPAYLTDKENIVYMIPDEEIKLCDIRPYDTREGEKLRLYDMPCQVYYHTYEIRHGESCDDKVTPEWAYNVYPNDVDKEIDIRWLEDSSAQKETLDRLNPPTTTTRLTTTKKPVTILNTTNIISSTTTNPYTLEDQDEECYRFLYVDCADPVTIFIIISVFAFVVLICLLTR